MTPKNTRTPRTHSVVAVMTALVGAAAIAAASVTVGAFATWTGYQAHPSVAAPTFRAFDVALAVLLVVASFAAPAWLGARQRARLARVARVDVERGEAPSYREIPESAVFVTNLGQLRARDHATRLTRAALGVSLALGVFFIGMSRIVSAAGAHGATPSRPNAWDFGAYFAVCLGVLLVHAAMLALGARMAAREKSFTAAGNLRISRAYVGAGQK